MKEEKKLTQEHQSGLKSKKKNTEDAFDRALDKVPKEIDIYVNNAINIVVEMNDVLERRNQKPTDLAKGLEKSDSEISKWFTGMHNFTLKSLAKIEVVIDSRLIYPANQVRDLIKLETEKLKKKVSKLTKEKLDNLKAIESLKHQLKDISASNEELLIQVEGLYNFTTVFGGNQSGKKIISMKDMVAKRSSNDVLSANTMSEMVSDVSAPYCIANPTAIIGKPTSGSKKEMTKKSFTLDLQMAGKSTTILH